MKYKGIETDVETAIAAPFVGAWIEMALNKIANDPYLPHPSWVRGLKC